MSSFKSPPKSFQEAGRCVNHAAVVGDSCWLCPVQGPQGKEDQGSKGGTLLGVVLGFPQSGVEGSLTCGLCTGG